MNEMRVNRRGFLIRAAAAAPLLLCMWGNALPGTRGIPFLLYHDISDEFDDEYTLSPSLFEKHLTWLHTSGYRTYSLSELQGGKIFRKENAVVISFDDGYASFMNFAFPLLKKYGYRCIMNVIGKYVGSSIEMGGERPMLGWDDYRYLVNSGLVDIGCHTHNLHEWNRWRSHVPERALRADLLLFQKTLLKETGRKTEILAWPYGIYDQKRMAVAKGAGFRYLLTSNDGYLGSVSGLFEIPRKNVSSGFGLASLRGYMCGKQ
jgi:peptidoglycan/xylan/chitin deacetylase (PgdA/CDA1 family)